MLPSGPGSGRILVFTFLLGANSGVLTLKPNIHFHLDQICFLVLLFSYFLVFVPLLFYLVVPVLNAVGLPPNLSSKSELNLGSCLFWGCHLVVIGFEGYLLLRLHEWKNRMGANCPKCKSKMNVDTKWYSSVSNYVCKKCGFRQRFEIKYDDKGGG